MDFERQSVRPNLLLGAIGALPCISQRTPPIIIRNRARHNSRSVRMKVSTTGFFVSMA